MSIRDSIKMAIGANYLGMIHRYLAVTFHDSYGSPRISTSCTILMRCREKSLRDSPLWKAMLSNSLLTC
jgi:hypothetical protein